MILTDVFPPDSQGGAALIPYYQAIGLRERGWKVGVITSCLEENNSETGVQHEQEILVHRLFRTLPLRRKIPSTFSNALQVSLSLSNPFMTAPIQKAIDNFQPDLIHAHHIPRISYKTFQTVSPSIPKILTFHTFHYECPKGGLFRKYRKTICSGKPLPCRLYQDRLKSTLQGTDAVIAISNFVEKRLSSSGYPRERLHYIPNGVPDLGTRHFSRPSRNKDILYVGRLDTNKGVAGLIQAFSEIRNEQTQLIIIGDGPTKASLEASAASDPRVVFLGWLEPSRVADWYRKSRIVVVPSVWHELMNTVICEAQSWGRAVIATDVGGNSDMIKDDYNGILVPAGDISALSNAMNYLVNSDAVADELGLRAFHSIKNFSLDSHLDALERLYTTLMKAQR